MNNSSKISSDLMLLDLLEIKAQSFRKSVKDICDDAMDILRGLNREY